jgi:NAD(P)-dependent dehydrogenase (short-subunit alcohol dehydrogenase family)
MNHRSTSPLAGKSAVVTGGVKGIGAAIVAAFVARGALVTVIDRDLPRRPVEDVDYVRADISDYGAIAAALDRVIDRRGALDLVVNNAGWDKGGPFIDNEPALWDELVRINLIGLFNMTHVALKLMRERGGGRFINIASDAGKAGSSSEAAYSACKGGPLRRARQLRLPGSDRHAAPRRAARGPGRRSGDGRDRQGDPASQARSTRGYRRRSPLFRRGAGPCHRPGAQRLRRPDDGELRR